MMKFPSPEYCMTFRDMIIYSELYASAFLLGICYNVNNTFLEKKGRYLAQSYDRSHNTNRNVKLAK